MTRGSIHVIAGWAIYVGLLAIPEQRIVEGGSAWYWAMDGLSFVVAPAVLVLLAASRRVVTARDLRYWFPRVSVIDWILQTIAVSALLWSAAYVCSLLGHALGFEDARHFSYAEVLPTGWSRSAAIVYLASTAAVSQEVCFRGLLHALLRQANWKHSIQFYVPVSTLTFTVVHWDKGPTTMASAALFGFVAAYLFSRRGHLGQLISAHFLVDLFWLGRI